MYPSEKDSYPLNNGAPAPIASPVPTIAAYTLLTVADDSGSVFIIRFVVSVAYNIDDNKAIIVTCKRTVIIYSI